MWRIAGSVWFFVYEPCSLPRGDTVPEEQADVPQRLDPVVRGAQPGLGVAEGQVEQFARGRGGVVRVAGAGERRGEVPGSTLA
jgi:hypothetical protein